jgi:hypothetical protein
MDQIQGIYHIIRKMEKELNRRNSKTIKNIKK